jgi:hypothetical protein
MEFADSDDDEVKASYIDLSSSSGPHQVVKTKQKR